MSVYDYLENPDQWTETGYVRTIQNPARSLIHFWMPKTISQRFYTKKVGHEFYGLWVGRVGNRVILEAAEMDYGQV